MHEGEREGAVTRERERGGGIAPIFIVFIIGLTPKQPNSYGKSTYRFGPLSLEVTIYSRNKISNLFLLGGEITRGGGGPPWPCAGGGVRQPWPWAGLHLACCGSPYWAHDMGLFYFKYYLLIF
jgi:hypothetical protein